MPLTSSEKMICAKQEVAIAVFLFKFVHLLILSCLRRKMLKRITVHVDELLTAKRDGNYDENDVRLIEEAIIASTMTRPKTTERTERVLTPHISQQESPSVPSMDFTHVRIASSYLT
jgi:hypothetical protein